MENYFTNAKVNWNLWSPESVIFKNGQVSKKLMPKENLLSYSSKGDRNVKISKLLGKGGHSAVHVWLKHTNDALPSAHIDFVDFSDRKYSNGVQQNSLDILVYIDPLHNQWDWQRDANGHWHKVARGNALPVEEGYKIGYGGQGDTNPMTKDEFIEVIEISEAVRNFLITQVIGLNEGDKNLVANDFAIA